jgi:acyl-CoA thioester hydrolase
MLLALHSLYKHFDHGDLRKVTIPSTTPTETPSHVLSHDVELRVRYAETDRMGVVYHANYLIWCEVGRTDFIRHCGMSYADMEKAGISLAVSEVTMRFHAAARYDDLIRVRTTLTDIRSRRITLDYLITDAHSGERLVTARTALVSVDSQGRTVAMPPSIRALFASS